MEYLKLFLELVEEPSPIEFALLVERVSKWANEFCLGLEKLEAEP